MGISAKPLVTVAIPTFNRSTTFLPASLGSARAQTYSELEILVADNASSDGTEPFLRSFQDDPRIRYHRQPSNLGSPGNMNFCIQAARGEYLVLLPDDDLLDADFVERCIERVTESPGVGLVRTGTRILNAGTQVLRELPNLARDGSFGMYLEDWVAGITSPYQCATLFRSDALKRVGLKSRHYLFDDVVAHFKVSAELGARNVVEPKVSFRVHSDGLTETTPIRDWCEETQDLLALMVELCPERRSFIETKGREFLAIGNYRRAMRRAPLERLAACATVFMTHGYAVPSRRVLMPAVRRRLQKLIRL